MAEIQPVTIPKFAPGPQTGMDARPELVDARRSMPKRRRLVPGDSSEISRPVVHEQIESQLPTHQVSHRSVRQAAYESSAQGQLV